MTEILYALLKISAFSAVLLAAVMVLRAALKKHASPAMIYALWFLLLIRFVFPITFESTTKLLVFEAKAEPEIQAENVQSVSQDSSDIYENTFFMDAEEAANDFGLPGKGTADGTVAETISEPVQTPQSGSPAGIMDYLKALDITFYIGALWIAVAGVLLSNIAVTAVSLRRYLMRQSLGRNKKLDDILAGCKKELGIKKNIQMVVIEKAASPSITAGFRPVIVIPEALLAESEREKLEFSIKHELMHFKRKDHIIYLVISVIKAAYWFNPAVYVMSRFMKMDMETACDSMVVRNMKDRSKISYAATILDMYAKNNEAPVALGMAIETTKKSAERRIRGIYMRQKSNRLAKALTALTALILAFACFTTACVPSEKVPDVLVPENKPENTALAENKPETTPEPTPEPKALELMNYDTPGTLEYTLENNTEKLVLTVDVNAEIVIPEYAIPIVEVTPKAMTFERVSAVTELITQGRPLYDSNAAEFLRTQTKILGEIEYYEKEIEMCTPDMQDQKKVYEGLIADLKEEYKTAPASYADAIFIPRSEQEPFFAEAGEVAATPTPMPGDLDTSGRIQPIILEQAAFGSQNYYLDIDEAKFPDSLRIWAADDIKQKGVYFKKARMAWETTIRSRPEDFISFDGVDFTLEQAKAIAAPFVYALAPELTLTEYACAVGWDHWGDNFEYVPEGYVLYYTPVYEGVSVRYTEPFSLRMPGMMEATGEVTRKEPNPQEYMAITVLKDGVFSLEYYNPSEQVNIVETNAQILPFDQIQKSFDDYIMGLSNKSGSVDYRAHITVNRIELSLMRVQTPDTDEYRMIPVWDFYGGSWQYYLIGERYENRYNEFYGRSYLTINALDGSIVDRETGY